MSFEIIYSTYYDAVYKKAEQLVKKYFIAQRYEKRKFGTALTNVKTFISTNLVTKYGFETYPELNGLYETFKRRSHIYIDAYAIQLILANEIQLEFNSFQSFQRPEKISLEKLILRMAILDMGAEILRLLEIQSQYLALYYELDDFSGFDIRETNGFIGEDPKIIEIRKKLPKKHALTLEEDLAYLYIIPEEHFDELEVAHNIMDNSINPGIENNIKYPNIFKNLAVFKAFLEYQKHIIDPYIDFSYLKKRLEVEGLIYPVTDNEFMRLAFEELSILTEKQFSEYCIEGKLRALSKCQSAQRQNNFNIIFMSIIVEYDYKKKINNSRD